MSRRQSRRRRLWLLLPAACALLVVLIGGNTLDRMFGVTTERASPAALSRKLSPAYRVQQPHGPGPFPTALLMSGCDGPQDNLDRWAKALAARGWASVIVDSHGPRDLNEAQIWRLVCAGQLLSGAERAGDVAVALADVRRMPFVDPQHLALIGASHGGWAVLDLLAFASNNQRPHTLRRWPGGSAQATLEGVQAILLLYPYCGPGSLVARQGWDSQIPMHMILVAEDSITDETDCQALTARMQARGRPVSQNTLSGVTHGFDQQNRAALSTLQFNAAATETALAQGLAFLNAPQDPTIVE